MKQNPQEIQNVHNKFYVTSMPSLQQYRREHYYTIKNFQRFLHIKTYLASANIFRLFLEFVHYCTLFVRY